MKIDYETPALKVAEFGSFVSGASYNPTGNNESNDPWTTGV